jgi:type I restriction enzyme S subunit
MAYKQVLVGDYFKFEKGLGYKGEFLVEDSEVALIGMDSHEEGGGYKEGSEKYYSGPFKEEHVAQIGDVIFAGTEQGFGLLGSPLIVPENEEIATYLFSGDVLKAVPLKADEFSTEYLYNIYRVQKYRRKVAYGDTGTTVRRISNDNFAEQLVPLPDLKTQESINEVISLIDQQIENNKSLAKNLEALAQAIFRSWFVDFEPVHAKSRREKPFGMDDEIASLFSDSFYSSEVGDIPKGWNSGSLSGFAKHAKRNVKVSEIKSETPYFGLEHIPRKSLFVFTWGSGEDLASNKSSVSVGDLLFGKLRPYFHKVSISPVEGICSTDIIVLQPTEPFYKCFMYFAVNQESFISKLSSASTGTRMPRTSWADMQDYQFVIPPENIVRKFDNLVNPFIEEGLNCARENLQLRNLRTALLNDFIEESEISVEELL